MSLHIFRPELTASWFSSVVVENEPIEGDDSDSEGSEDEHNPGETLLVRNHKVRLISGMEQYERIVEKRLAKRGILAS